MKDSLKRWLANHDIQYILHTHPAVYCHSNINTETLQIPGGEFRKLIKATGTTLEVRNLPLMEPNHKNL